MNTTTPPDSKKEGELWRAASEVVKQRGLALLATADEKGLPHMTWMNAVVSPHLEEVITATAPNTLKVANVAANSQVEWMFSSPSMETLVYLTGSATILKDAAEAEACWNQLPGKAQAYFQNYCESNDFNDFSLIRTVVNEVVYCRPQGYRKTLVYRGGAEVPG